MQGNRQRCLTHGLRWALVLSISALTANAAAADLKQALDTLKSVKKLGEGNVAASAAWKTVAQAPPSQLLVVLAAMNDAQPLALNWIRSAVDASAEAALSKGQKLPAADLEAFVKNAKNAPRARRLAFEWLSRVDATTPDRLIPSMLNDPGLEFRRDAVQRLADQAEQETKDGQADQALATYRKAFEHARDVDQIQQLADKLKERGQKLDLPAEMGFILDWKLIGPFDNHDLVGFEKAYPPEEQIDFSAKYPGKSGEVAWVDYSTADDYGMVDLNKALGKANGVVAYAAVEFVAPTAREVDLRLGSGNASKVWLNGKLLTLNASYHANEGIDQFVGKGQLKAGQNLILLKILQNEQKESWAQKWEFQFRVCDALGAPVLAQNRKPSEPRSARLKQTDNVR